MKLIRYSFVFSAFFALFLVACTSHPKHTEVTLGSLLQEMTNRELKAQYPNPTFICRQFSSYDRASSNPQDPKTWFSNWDRSMFVRVDSFPNRNEYVMMDTEGPGAIVRFWMTFGGKEAGEGILRVYFDNDSLPAIQGNALEILSGGKLVGAPLSTSVSDTTDYKKRGHNLYLPLPYSKHCKVTYETKNIKDFGAKTGGECVYYNIDYRTYPKETKVITYSSDELKKYKSILLETQKKLQERDVDLPITTQSQTLTGKILPSKQITTSLNKPLAAIRKLSFKIKANNLEQALRSTILEISFDGISTVKCPLGDFFGTGYQIRSSNTWYTKVNVDGTLECFWVMPFKKSCTVTLENMGKQDVEVLEGTINFAPYSWNKETMYFASSWKQYTHLATGEMKNQEGGGGPFDMHYIAPQGKGVYMGDAISLFNTVYAWWGEGDEKVYVDGEVFPSHFGTGSEDYYGYAWCRPEKFSNHPFIAQPDGSGNFTPGYTVNMRFRDLDGIPFQKSLRFDMEMWHWTRTYINFAPICYWYICPEDAVKSMSILSDAQEKVAIHREDIISPKIINHEIECENMQLIKIDGGDFWYDNDVHMGWSGNVQLAWNGAKKGQELTLIFVSDKEEDVKAVITYNKAPHSGDYTVSINGRKSDIIKASASKFDLATIEIKKIHLKIGNNIMKIQLLSSSEKNSQVGIDCVHFK